VSLTHAEPPPTETIQVPGQPLRVHAVWLEWDDYLLWATGKLQRTTPEWWGRPVKLPPPWAPGMHWALIGPTGEGKTTHSVGVLGQRKYVLALDPKGEDTTLAASGFRRVTGLPPKHKFPKDIQKDLDDGKAVRLIVGGSARTDEEDAKLQQLMREAITYARHAGHWALYVDEFELLSSQRMYKLGPLIERMLITARKDETSVVTSFQAAAWVSKHATRQATLCTLWPTRDRDMLKAVAQSMGRDWKAVANAVDLLPPFHTLTIPKQIRAPMIMTTAPKVGGGGQVRGQQPSTGQRGQQQQQGQRQG
jgi:hypothetical protein